MPVIRRILVSAQGWLRREREGTLLMSAFAVVMVGLVCAAFSRVCEGAPSEETLLALAKKHVAALGHDAGCYRFEIVLDDAVYSNSAGLKIGGGKSAHAMPLDEGRCRDSYGLRQMGIQFSMEWTWTEELTSRQRQILERALDVIRERVPSINITLQDPAFVVWEGVKRFGIAIRFHPSLNSALLKAADWEGMAGEGEFFVELDKATLQRVRDPKAPVPQRGSSK